MNETSTLADLLEQAAARHNNASGRRLAEIAQQAGIDVSHATLNRIRNGTYKSTPSDATIRAIAYLAGVDEGNAFRSAGTLPPESTYVPPPEADRMDQRQRKALDELIRAFVPRPISATTAEERKVLFGSKSLLTWLEIVEKRRRGEPLSEEEVRYLDVKTRDENERQALSGMYERIESLDRGYKLYLNSLVETLLEEQELSHAASTEEVQEPRPQEGGTQHRGKAGAHRGRPGAPIGDDKVVTLNPAAQASGLDRSSSHLPEPSTENVDGTQDDGYEEWAAMKGETQELRRRRLEGEPWDQPDPDGPEDGA